MHKQKVKSSNESIFDGFPMLKKENRLAVLYVRIKPENRTFITGGAERHGISHSLFLDLLISGLREGKWNVPKMKKESIASQKPKLGRPFKKEVAVAKKISSLKKKASSKAPPPSPPSKVVRKIRKRPKKFFTL